MLGPPPVGGQLPTPTHMPMAPPGIDTPPGMGMGVPEPVSRFLVSLSRALRERKVYEVHQAIESGWTNITNQYYKSAPWPPAEAVAPLVDHDDTFMVLYKELAYRHVYSRLQPTVHDRLGSWENYEDLFSMLLDLQRPMRLDLPNQWLWDIIDELVYQFQSFCQFRSKRKARTAEDIEVLKANPEMFSAQRILEMLQKAIDKSKVVEVMRAMRASGFQAPQLKGGAFEAGPGAPEDDFAQSNTYVMLGYFALIGQARVHCLLSDYHTALATLDDVDMSKKNGLFARVAACHVTLYYYVGFSYLMLKRYADAVRSFSSAITFVQRTKQYHTRSYQYDAIMKKTEQMYHLLAMAVALSPTRIDDNIRQTLREKLGDKFQRMQRGEEAVFEELFTYSCPKFIVPSAPNYDSPPANTGTEAYRHQLRLFIAEVRQQVLLPTIRSYLRLYTSIGVPKLAGFLGVDVAEFRAQLLALKHKFRRPMWPGGGAPPAAGEVVNCADVEFTIEDDVVCVISSQDQGQYHTDFFVRNVKKLEEVRAKLDALDVVVE